MTVIVDGKRCAADAPQIDFDDVGVIVADRSAADGRHIVIADSLARHRVWLRAADAVGPAAFVLPADMGFAIRLAATQRFEARLRGCGAGMTSVSTAHPTAFQRQRLILLLRLLDAAHAKATKREMAVTIIYPRTTSLTGAAWKGSNERRRTLRLLAEATRMMRGGYRALLQS